ncbi:unnamed protein product [Taenia asiatica]|uniref:SprT-like domain-containing protein n=1 Tax=Taenia asiatica TaxID=60517 RepID=A0A158R9U9_TAEAS|nr:unnamed protein product [Taenia asiatica]
MRFCVCGKGCSDVLSLIRCNNTYRSVQNEKADLSQVPFAVDKSISACLDDNPINCDPLSISSLDVSSQSAAVCEEANCAPALCLGSETASAAKTQKKTHSGKCAAPHCGGIHNLSLRILPHAEAKVASLAAPAHCEGIGSGVQDFNESISSGNKTPDCLANSVGPVASSRLSSTNFSDSRSGYCEIESSSGSEALEDLLTRLRTDEPTDVQSKGHPGLLFVVSDNSSSPDLELNNNPSFYHQIDNAHLKKSTKKLMSLRKKLRFDSSSETSDGEVEKTSTFDPPGGDEFDPHAQVDLPTSTVNVSQRSRPWSVEKATHLKAIENVQPVKDLTLPFIYSLSTLDCLAPSQTSILKRHPSAERREVRIELSGKVCTSAERVRDTLLHEACHAAVWLVHGVNDGHGRLWRAFVHRANAVFPHLPPITVRHTYAIDTRFTYRCTGCFATINRHSKSLDIQKKVCGRCQSQFQLFVNKGGKITPVNLAGGKKAASAEVGSRSRSVFADFVKVHYGEVRGASSTHKDAMAQLGSMFRSMKLGSGQEKEN